MRDVSEFLQDFSGAFSMGRLLVFGAFIVSSGVMLWLVYTGKMSEGYLSEYLAAHGFSFAWSKSQDNKSVPITPPAPVA